MHLFINWAFDAEIIPGYRTPNWYGLLFVSGMILGYFVIRKMFKQENISNELLDKLVMYMVPATVIGARLGHVFFYGPYWGPEGYLSNPIEIFKIWEGGLASHGAAIVILLALWYFSNKVIKRPYLWMLDRIAAPVAIAGAFIRLGNLVNHEMVGYVTDVPWGFRFLHHDCMNLIDGQYLCEWSDIPVRHPANLYESLAYFLSFGILMFLFWKKHAWKKQGMVFGTFLILIFGFRFLIEFVKESQTDNDSMVDVSTGLNTGQWLSVPLVLAGIILIILARKKSFEEA
ncbi:MAG: prolipoprotein diacylglyceryl transferase [Cryomorphaceae bacterium]|nr:prolipoprotein diacylglyceryl transferase [Cryomorphaceae bacterium]